MIAEFDGIRQGIDRRESESGFDLLDPNRVICRRPCNHGRFDTVLFTQNPSAAPGCDRVVCAEEHGRQGCSHVGVGKNGFDTVGTEQSVAQFERAQPPPE